MRLFLNVVTFNEADRYLARFLVFHSWIFDKVAIFDDQSTDHTVQIAETYRASVTVRPDDCPSFLQHEGQFRQRAWETMVEKFQPTDADWIVTLDADEFLVSSYAENNPRQATLLFAAAINAEKRKCKSVNIPIPEVFEVSKDKDVLIRTDGYWGGQSGPRMCQYQPGATFNDQTMASGQLPTYAYKSISEQNCSLAVLHFGYVREEDRVAKYERYKGRPGHNPTHIESILTPPTLEKWEGQKPSVSILETIGR